MKLTVLRESQYYDDALYVEIRSDTGETRTLNMMKDEVVNGIEGGQFE
jgi:hypothetical protein